VPTVSRTFSVTTPPAKVIDYLKDFANTEEWDPGTQTCTQVDGGPIAEGTTWHNESKISGVKAELVYVLKQLTNDELVLVGTNKASTSTDTIAVEPDGGGSTLTYRADLEMHGVARCSIP
jgi:carbon monoxide dehydrogenase subunit G